MRILKTLVAAAMVFAATQSAFGQTALSEQHQLFIMKGTVNGTTTERIEEAINGWFAGDDWSAESDIVEWYDNTEGLTHDLVDLGYSDENKVEEPNTSNGGILEVTYDSKNKTGTWTTTDGSLVEFYTVKGSNSFALWYIEGGSNNAEWSTVNLENGGGNQPAISNLAIFETEIPETDAPLSGSVLAFGLAGLVAGFLRRRK